MNSKLFKIGMGLAAIVCLQLATNIFVGVSLAKAPTHTVVQVKEIVVMTDKQRINLLIDELLNKKSARCFRQILIHESHINPKAKNPNSSAKGVGQLLASTYRNLGLKHSNDGMAQTVAALAYISRHYGGANAPCKAWRHWKQFKSY